MNLACDALCRKQKPLSLSIIPISSPFTRSARTAARISLPPSSLTASHCGTSSEGGNPRRLTTEPSDDVVPSWSRDGRWIYFSCNSRRSIQIWKVPGGEREALQRPRKGVLEGSESPDDRFFYNAKRNPAGIWK